LNTASVVERAGDIERALGATDEARRLYQHAQWLGNASTQLADKIAQLPTP
jgi:predicted negative regulator of RcsB-dependent stress response